MPRGGYRPGSGRKPGFTSPYKNMTYEEKYGKERAKIIKEKLSKSQKEGFTSGRRQSHQKGKTWEELYGKERAEELKTRRRAYLKEYYKTHDAPNKGKKGIGLGHPFYGPFESNKKGKNYEELYGKEKAVHLKSIMSKAHIGKKHPNRKSPPPVPLEVREKISQSLKEFWSSGSERVKKLREEFRERRLNQVFPMKNSSLEEMVFKELNNKNVDYKKHFPIKGQPDIVFEDEQIAVFLDGCYWHGCSLCGFDGPKSRPKNRDKEVTASLESKGWTVLRFWEHDIVGNPKWVVDEMLEHTVKGGVSDG